MAHTLIAYFEQMYMYMCWSAVCTWTHVSVHLCTCMCFDGISRIVLNIFKVYTVSSFHLRKAERPAQRCVLLELIIIP